MAIVSGETVSTSLDAQRTHMFREARESAAALRRQFVRNNEDLQALGAVLRKLAPRAVVTCARGSSDHAATYAKYLIETQVHVLTASAAPSVSSIYLSEQDMKGCLFLAISQSGRSPDLVATANAARRAGATVIALINAEGSPLAQVAQHTVPLCAGNETSVAATKSFIASLAAILHLVAAWTDDSSLLAALQSAPDLLDKAWALDWSDAVTPLQRAEHLYVIGRGLGLAIAQEAALKCKETCGLHAEAFSSAEVLHGPQALLSPKFPAFLLSQHDDTRDGITALAAELVGRDVPVFSAGASAPGVNLLPTLQAHPAIEPLLLAQSFYRLANALALLRGFNPDEPPHLRKVTRTL